MKRKKFRIRWTEFFNEMRSLILCNSSNAGKKFYFKHSVESKLLPPL